MEITIEQIVSVFKNSTEEKRLKDIKADVVALVMQNKELALFDEGVSRWRNCWWIWDSQGTD